LLVVDNCEHLIDACAQLTDALLRECPSLHILATSREAPRTAAEATWHVATLGVADPQADVSLDLRSLAPG
jgi:predicted ATPase